jgi:RNA polymerase sigma-70 factor (ECF subfamily)
LEWGLNRALQDLTSRTALASLPGEVTLSEGGFRTTRWSLIARLREDPGSSASSALEELCEIYWPAVLAFLRRRLGDSERARDCTQGFFTDLLERDALLQADPDRGRFRSFLLKSLQNFLANEQRRERALKRGGGLSPISLESPVDAVAMGADAKDPEQAFQRAWAVTVLEKALDELRSNYQQAGKAEAFEILRPFVTPSDALPAVAELARRLGKSEGAVKVQVHRFRNQFGEALRDVILDSVHSEADVESEIQDLFRAFRSSPPPPSSISGVDP